MNNGASRFKKYRTLDFLGHSHEQSYKGLFAQGGTNATISPEGLIRRI